MNHGDQSIASRFVTFAPGQKHLRQVLRSGYCHSELTPGPSLILRHCDLGVCRLVHLAYFSAADCNSTDSTVNRLCLNLSCGAAIRVKPRARLCEPWVMVSYMLRSREAAAEV